MRKLRLVVRERQGASKRVRFLIVPSPQKFFDELKLPFFRTLICLISARISVSQKRAFLTLSNSPSRTIIFIDVQSFKTYPEIKVSKAIIN
jgi:hypothetical protein